MFYTGQKVVCIAKGEWVGARKAGLNIPERGKIYTVRDVTYFEQPGLRLVEVVNTPVHTKWGLLEYCWAQHEFRPLVDKKTDISIFTSMLNPKAINNDRDRTPDTAEPNSDHECPA